MPADKLTVALGEGTGPLDNPGPAETSPASRLEVAAFNVKFSPNFGDGLLAICLERALEQAAPVLRVNSIDLAGRRAFGKGNPYRGSILSAMEVMPSTLRSMATRIYLEALAAWRLRPFYREALANCRVVVVGGGNLFADADLNFPIKIAAALAETNRRSLPVAVYGVGVTSNWSKAGRRMFARNLHNAKLIDVSTRDERSRRAWDDLLAPAGIRPAGLALDPGLLAHEYFARTPDPRGGHPIALGITDPRAIRYHGGREDVADYLVDWYGDIAAALAQAGHDVVLFTNGSTEDRTILAQHGAAWCARAPDRIRICPDFAEPAALVGFLAGSKLVIAHRMHACIAAYSFAIPSIGLKWDVKLDSFFALAERHRYIIDPADVDAGALVNLAALALAEGVDAAHHRGLLDQCRADIARLADILVRAACGTPQPDAVPGQPAMGQAGAPAKPAAMSLSPHD